MTSERQGPWIRTYTGGRFYLLDPRTEDINLVDIAHHLALLPRFTGAVIYPYSVAEHSYRVAREVAKTHPQFYLEALLHDAPEAYIGDLNRPLKHDTPVGPPYREVEARIGAQISVKFSLDWNRSGAEVIKEADRKLYETERRDLLSPLRNDPSEPLAIREVQPLPGVIFPMRWQDAEAKFLFEVHKNARKK